MKESERKSWWYVNFYMNNERSVVFIVLATYILFAKYANGRFCDVWTMFIDISGKFMHMQCIRQW